MDHLFAKARILVLLGIVTGSAASLADECYFTGQNRLTKVPGKINFFVPLAEGRAALIVRPNGKLEIGRRKSNFYSSLNSEEIKSLGDTVKGKIVNEISHSKSGLYSLAVWNSSAHIINTETLEVHPLTLPVHGGGLFTDDERRLLILGASSIHVVDLDSKKSRELARSELNSFLFLDPTGRFVFDISFKRVPDQISKVVWMDLSTLEQRVYSGRQISMGFNSVTNTRWVAIGKSKYSLKQPEFSVSPLTQNGYSGYETVDVDSAYHLSARLLTFLDGSNRINVYLPTFSYTSRWRTVSAADNIVDWTEQEDYSYVSTYSRKSYACAKTEPIRCRDCGAGGPISATQALNLFLPAKSVRCDTTFEEDRANWLALTPSYTPDLDEETLVRWLFRISKPGGFEIREHLSVVLGLLENPELVSRHRELVSQVMLNVLLSSSNLYSSLTVKYAKVLKDLPQVKLACLTDEEREQLRAPVFPMLKRGLVNSMNDRPLSGFNNVKQYAELLTEEQKVDLAESIGDMTARFSVARDHRFHNVFFSKIYQFSYQAARRLLGLKTVPVTDITIVDNISNGRGTFTATILGSRPVHLANSGFHYTPLTPVQRESQGRDNDEEDDEEEDDEAPPAQPNEGITQGGVHFVDGIPLDTKSVGIHEKTQEVTWTIGKSHFMARIAIIPIQHESNFFVREDGFRYSELLKNRELRGVIVAGANLGESEDTIKEYQAYYEASGFVFGKETLIGDTEAYLAQKTYGNKPMSYFIKEAHSDGDEKNLFRIAVRSRLLVGFRKGANFDEVVELITPDGSDGSKLISNQAFGEWVRQRERNGLGQLIYVNGSCWSHNKARAEAAAARSPVLIEIPTLTMASTFTNSDNDALRILIEGIRFQKNYAQMREALSVVDGFKTRTDDVYIFPDEGDYTTSIVDRVLFSFDFKVEMFEKVGDQWMPYHLDQRLNQDQ